MLRVLLDFFFVWSCNTFENISEIENKYKKYLEESRRLDSSPCFSFKCFSKDAFVREISSKSSGYFWLLRLPQAATGINWLTVRNFSRGETFQPLSSEKLKFLEIAGKVGKLGLLGRTTYLDYQELVLLEYIFKTFSSCIFRIFSSSV